MAGEANIQFSGFVHKEPVLRFISSGVAVCKMTVKVTPYNPKTQEKKNASWYQVSVWRDAAEAVMETVKEGDRVLVTGSLEISSYEKDGEKKYVPEVTAYSVGVIPKRVEAVSEDVSGDKGGSPW